MDILSGGLIFLTVLTAYESVSLLRNKLDFNAQKFKKIGLENYTIERATTTKYGKQLLIKIPVGGSILDLENNLLVIQNAFSCKAIIKSIPYSSKAIIDLITKDVTTLDYTCLKLEQTKLLLGYNYKLEPIVADMQITPHLLLTGLSGNGKTGCVRVAIKNLLDNNNADVVLLNAFLDDYKDFYIRKITNHNNIKIFLKNLLEQIDNNYKRDKPLYIFFEELGKVKDKELIDITTKILQYGRHNKIYLIGIIQTATKEELKFKQLFNARLTFKQLEESSYRVVLGCNVSDKLLAREFYIFTDAVYKGKTYNLDF